MQSFPALSNSPAEQEGRGKDRIVIRAQELGEGEMLLLVIFCYRGHRKDTQRIHEGIFLIETESQSLCVWCIKCANIIPVKNTGHLLG